MNVSELFPLPEQCETFKRNRERYIPSKPGCYVLATFSKVVLYIGLTNNLRRRMIEHLDNPEKTSVTEVGRPVFFFWIESIDTNKIERTWMNIHNLAEAGLPKLNKVYSPTST